MCGLSGIMRLSSTAPPIDLVELRAVRDAMATRGPDGTGEWLSPSGLAAFGHRRLAIIDLSPAGAQPMASSDGRYVLVLNGEVYNHAELRAELQRSGYHFRSLSDTEVVLAAFEREGPGAFERLRGMFAVAVWDEKERRLVLARDAFGIKPLYYALHGDTIRFASQVRALDRACALPQNVDSTAVAAFLLWGSVPEPLTLRRTVRALPAGHWMSVDASGAAAPQRIRPRLGEAPLSVAEALEDSVRAHLVADVPVALFLSAGIDSALIACLAARLLPAPPTTFTVTFPAFRGTRFDEGPGARDVARRLGTRHVELEADASRVEEDWAAALGSMDQPSIDGFNVYLVSRLAHEAGLKVALTGIGGDELAGGYPSFRDVPRWHASARLLQHLPGLASAWPGIARRLRPGQPKLRGLLRHGGTLEGAYLLKRGLFLPEELPALLGERETSEALAAYDPLADVRRACSEAEGVPRDRWETVQAFETHRYMRHQLLRDADWASMAHALELRVPLVDPILAAAMRAARFEPARRQGKSALLTAVNPTAAAHTLTRRKTGFMVPTTHDRFGSWGAGARERALEVLRAFGVDLPRPPGARA